MLDSAMIKSQARKFGAARCGIGDIAGFAGVASGCDPKSILPAARCIIGCVFAVPRTLFRVMERGRQFFNYVQTGVKVIDEELAEVFLLRMAALIENAGYDACVQRNVSNLRRKGDKSTNPEVVDTYELALAEAVAPGKPAPEVMLDFGLAAEVCGLGARSMRGRVLVPELGPFCRMVFIVTDAPLEPDAPFEGNLCDSCGECIKACPGHAVTPDGTDSWQCAVYYRGAHRSNPLMKESFLAGDPRREAILNGDFRFDAKLARELYPELDFLPSRSTGYAGCLCGRRCDTVCYRHLKAKGRL